MNKPTTSDSDDDSTNDYPINKCPQPWFPAYRQFFTSFCEGNDEHSWLLVCTNPYTGLMKNRLFRGECHVGYICQTRDLDSTEGKPPTAWCLVPGYNSSDAGSSTGSENGTSENGTSENSNSRNSDSEANDSEDSASDHSMSGNSLIGLIKRIFR